MDEFSETPPPEEEFGTLVDYHVGAAETMKAHKLKSFAHWINHFGYDVSLLHKYGCALLDVDAGNELVIFTGEKYRPKKIWVSEPDLSGVPDQEGMRKVLDPVKIEAIRRLAGALPLVILREHLLDALEKLPKDEKVGFIGAFWLFPTHVEDGFADHVLDLAGDRLVDGGMVILGCDGHLGDELGIPQKKHEQFVTKGVFTDVYNGLGDYILVAIKRKSE